MMLLDWLALKHFKKYGTSDVWGDPDKMDAMLLLKLDSLRSFIDKPIHVLSGYREGDKKQHGMGLAVDIVCPDISLLDFWIAAERYNFNGIGVYPHWRYDGVVVGGIHVDERVLGTRIGSVSSDLMGARWLAFRDSSGNQIYTTLSKETLKRYEVI